MCSLRIATINKYEIFNRLLNAFVIEKWQYLFSVLSLFNAPFTFDRTVESDKAISDSDYPTKVGYLVEFSIL